MKNIRVASVASIAAVLLVFCANAYRVQFGIDVSDESYYVAMAYRFALGDQPFVDEFSLHQGAALLVYPALKFYLWVSGGPDGIMLFARYLYLAFTSALAILVFTVLRKSLDWRIALLVAAQCLVFAPFNIHSLSYYTLGSGFLTAGLFIGLHAASASRSNLALLVSGLFNGLAVVAYPALLVPAAAAAVLLWYTFEEKKSILSHIAGGTIIACGILAFLIAAGTDQIRANIANFLSYYGPVNTGSGQAVSPVFGFLEWLAYYPIFGKLLRATLRFLEWFPNEGLIPKLIFLGVLIGLRKGALWARYGLLASPLLMVQEPTVVAAQNFLRNYALLAPFLLYFLWPGRYAKQMFYVVWLPAFVASLAVAGSSGNGAYVAAVGFFPGSLVTAVYSVMLLKAWLPQTMPITSTNDSWPIRAIPTLPALSSLAVLVLSMGVVFREAPIFDLDTKVEAGPYRGIFTTKSNESYLEQMRQDIVSVFQPGRRILCIYYSPAAYLFTTMRPATNATLLQSPAMVPGFNVQGTLDYFVKAGINPDIVFLVKKLPVGEGHGNKPVEMEYLADDPLYKKMTGPEYRLAIQREHYLIYLHVHDSPAPLPDTRGDSEGYSPVLVSDGAFTPGAGGIAGDGRHK